MVFLVVVIGLVIVIGGVSYRIGISPVDRNNEDPIIIEITPGSTYHSIGELLKENNLIRSISFYRVYIWIFKPDNLQAGIYTFNQSMGVSDIIDILENNKKDTLRFTIPEGRRFLDVVKRISDITYFEEEELISIWNSREFVDSAIDKYWFITNEVKNPNLRFSLEGYFFPDTYTLNSSATAEQIGYMMLDRMDQILTRYKEEIEASKFTVHEILTMASIVEHEATTDEDRSKVAAVFFNRLNINMRLQSCATLGYAIGEWKLIYNYQDMAYNSPYNTYLHYGLPVGPGGLPGEKSIIATLRPANVTYLFFMANTLCPPDNQTYFARTYAEHQQNIRTHLKAC